MKSQGHLSYVPICSTRKTHTHTQSESVLVYRSHLLKCICNTDILTHLFYHLQHSVKFLFCKGWKFILDLLKYKFWKMILTQDQFITLFIAFSILSWFSSLGGSSLWNFKEKMLMFCWNYEMQSIGSEKNVINGAWLKRIL